VLNISQLLAGELVIASEGEQARAQQPELQEPAPPGASKDS